MNFTKVLIAWYLRHKRDLPWRQTRDPYRIWLSEIMLQQTRVQQAMPYYFSFTEAFETVDDLAQADEEMVLKLWQGLGYYSRARNLHHTAQLVSEAYHGVFPQDYQGLLKLKGVGTYTASAIASFSYGEAVPVVDGNVFRLLARYFGIETDIASPAAKREFTELAMQLLPHDDAATFNQAMMEFGAIQCVPKNPDCKSCPMQNSCVALRDGKVNQLPIKIKKVKVKERFLNYVVLRDDAGNSLLQKRIGKGIWRNLYEFPLVETSQTVDLDEFIPLLQQSGLVTLPIKSVGLFNTKPVVHKLTHQKLEIRFWDVAVAGLLPGGLDHTQLQKLPVPIVLHQFIMDEFGSRDGALKVLV